MAHISSTEPSRLLHVDGYVYVELLIFVVKEGKRKEGKKAKEREKEKSEGERKKRVGPGRTTRKNKAIWLLVRMVFVF